MGLGVYGTDLEPRMAEYSKANMQWLQKTFQPPGQSWRIETADATTFRWPHPFTVIAGETYLGRPFSMPLDPLTLKEVMQDVNHIHQKFLRNVALQTEPGFQLGIAVPAWKTS